MGMDFELYRAWANAAKGIRQCQKADKVLWDGDLVSAQSHFNKALDCFNTAGEHMKKAEDDANVKAAHLLDNANQQLQKAIDQYAGGDADGAQKHYAKALDKYDEALDLMG